MSLLDRLRGWLFGAGDDVADGGGSEGPSATNAEEGGDRRLDPNNVDEVRTSTDDDPLERLRELDRERPDDGESVEADGNETTSDVGAEADDEGEDEIGH